MRSRTSLKRELLILTDELAVDERLRDRPLTDVERARKRFVNGALNLYRALIEEEGGSGKKEKTMPLLSSKNR